MSRNQYNELYDILKNLSSYEVSKLPEKYIEFVKTQMDPSAEPVSVDMEKLSPETKNLLGALTLTYWAGGTSGRRELAETMHKNQLAYEGKPDIAMTEEEYQDFLSVFDDWNERFGPIPYWTESRKWIPAHLYEVLPGKEEAAFSVGDLYLKEVQVSRKEREQVLEEAKQWVLVEEIKEEEELYWHNDDRSSWTYTREKEDFYKHWVVIKDGHFYGALLSTVHRSGAGMSYYKNEENGVLCIDGSSFGRTDEYEYRSSDESSHSTETIYHLRKKQSPAS